MSYVKFGAAFLILLTAAAFVWASESNEIRAKARAMQLEAAELAERGHREEATNLEREAMEILKEAERLDRRRPDQRVAEMMEMQRILRKLRLEERELVGREGNRERLEDVRREAERIEMELREISHDRHRERAAPRKEIARRLEHMQIAVEHLNHAGLHDVAEHIAERARATKREMHTHRVEEENFAIREIITRLDEIQHEVGRLREEVNDLQQKR